MSRSKEINLTWLKAYTKGTKEYEDMKSTVKGSSVLLNRLLEIIQERKQSHLSAERKKTQYQTNDWAYLQAHRNGNLEELEFIESLLDHLN